MSPLSVEKSIVLFSLDSSVVSSFVVVSDTGEFVVVSFSLSEFEAHAHNNAQIKTANNNTNPFSCFYSLFFA